MGKYHRSHADSVDDQITDINANLNAALHALRYDDLPQAIGINAFCISQSDVYEKNTSISRLLATGKLRPRTYEAWNLKSS